MILLPWALSTLQDFFQLLVAVAALTSVPMATAVRRRRAASFELGHFLHVFVVELLAGKAVGALLLSHSDGPGLEGSAVGLLVPGFVCAAATAEAHTLARGRLSHQEQSAMYGSLARLPKTRSAAAAAAQASLHPAAPRNRLRSGLLGVSKIYGRSYTVR